MHKIASALAVGLLVAGVVPATVLAGADRSQAPAPLSGSWDDCNFDAVVTTDGPNTIVVVSITENYHGSLSGAYAGTERDVVHSDGSVAFGGSGTYTGSVNGRAGTGRLSYDGAVPSSGVMPATGPDSGRWVLVGRTGQLRGVVAGGRWGAAPLGSSPTCDAGLYGGTYSGQLVTR